MIKIDFLDSNPFVLQDFSWRASIPGRGFTASCVGIFLNSGFGKLWNYSRAVPLCAPGLLCYFFSPGLAGEDYWVVDGAGVFPSLGVLTGSCPNPWILIGIGTTPMLPVNV